MNNTIKSYVALILGAAIGSGITWYIAKAKYQKIADDEIEKLREFYKNKSKKEEMSQANQNKKDISEYSKTVKENGYHDYSTQKEVPIPDKKEKVTEKEEEHNDIPEEPKTTDKIMKEPGMEIKGITPEQFDAIDEYEKNYLVYYADDVLADARTNEIIPTPSSEVGYLFENEFDVYETDVAYICNFTMGTKYEIQKTRDLYKDDELDGGYAEEVEDF